MKASLIMNYSESLGRASAIVIIGCCFQRYFFLLLSPKWSHSQGLDSRTSFLSIPLSLENHSSHRCMKFGPEHCLHLDNPTSFSSPIHIFPATFWTFSFIPSGAISKLVEENQLNILLPTRISLSSPWCFYRPGNLRYF